jgi:hypothetical protein
MTEPLQIARIEGDETSTRYTLSDGQVVTDLTELQRLVGGTLVWDSEDPEAEPRGIVFGPAPGIENLEALEALKDLLRAKRLEMDGPDA